jgi:dual specificity protein kinase YAK1
MNNRVAFIDFVRGLLNINPLERWSPQQAKLHPFITQAKFTGPFVPPTNLKSSSMAKSPAPGTQAQQEAVRKYQEQEMRQRQAQAQAQAHQAQQQQAQQQQAAQQAQQYAMGGYHQGQQAPVYNNMYTPPQAASSGGNAAYGSVGNTSYLPTHVNTTSQMQQQQQQAQYNQHQQPSLYQQASTRSAMQRQRASTGVDGVPVQIQRAASLMDPTQPIRLQPSPAYYPPGPDGSGGRRGKGNQGKDYQKNKDLIRNLEDRTLEDGNMFNHWGGGGGN